MLRPASFRTERSASARAPGRLLFRGRPAKIARGGSGAEESTMATETREIDSVFSMIRGAEGASDHVEAAIARARKLPCWSGPVEPTVLSGGLSNANLVVEDAKGKFVVKIGEDAPHMGVYRSNEVLAMRASHAAGVSPEVIYDEPGIIVLRFVEGRSLTPADVREPGRLRAVARLLQQLHRKAHKHLEGPGFIFWPQHHIRWYLNQCEEKKDGLNPEWYRLFARYRAATDEADAAVGRVRIVFCHNDVLPQNFIDDGKRLWLVDWEYSGYDLDLFDLAGIGMNIDITPQETTLLLETYYEEAVSDELRRRFVAAMLLTSLRETAWSFLAEVTPRPVAFDYSIYSRMNVERFDRIHAYFKQL